MLEAAKPAVYRPFFGHLTAKSGGAAVNLPSAMAQRTRVSKSENQKSKQTQYSPKDRQIANRLISQLSRDEQVECTVALSRSLRGLKMEKIPDAIAKSLETLKFDPNIASASRAAWEYAVRDLTGTMPPSAEDPQYGRCLLYTSPSPRDRG